jgi:hypothetical protein
VIGTVFVPDRQFYLLDFALSGTDDWREFASGTTEVTSSFLGTFDPTGQLTSADHHTQSDESYAYDANLYRYVLNSPLTFTDPFGEQAEYATTLSRGTVGAILAHPFTQCFAVSFVTSEFISLALRAPAIAVSGPPTLGELISDTAVNITISAVSCYLFPPAAVAQVLFGSSVVAIDLLALGTIAARGVAVGSATFVGQNLIAMARREYEPNKPGRKKQGREADEKKRKHDWQPRNPPREPPPHTPSKKT